MTGVLVDNDIIIKVAAYGLGEQFVRAATILDHAPSMLGVGRFVVRDRLLRGDRLKDNKRASEHFEAVLECLATAEPTETEVEQAAAFEAAAARANLEFDTGESQLLAMLITRGSTLLITGDKRAIVAVPQICGELADGRIACFEQFVATSINELGATAVREAVCREPQADIAATNCCACASFGEPNSDEIIAGLCSYINDLRSRSGATLYGDDNLLSLTSKEDSVGVN